ncbi:hypothetical protein H5410_057260, partial [Solanum commersonii]
MSLRVREDSYQSTECGAVALVDLLGVGVVAVSIAPSSGSKSPPLILESTCVPRQTKDSHPSGL